MKYTLLEIVQDILSSMDSDEVTSITDTVESQQVAKVVRTVYYDIINRAKPPEQSTLFQLTETSASTPVIMTVPSTFNSVDWIKYDVAAVGDPIEYTTMVPVPIEDFLDRMYSLVSTDTNVDTFTSTIGSSTINFLHYNDRAPTYYATYDDNTIVFDSYDSTVETYLRSTKSLAFGLKRITWDESDAAVPDLNDLQFQLLLNEAKSLAWAELKQTTHTKAEVTARREWVSMQNNIREVKGVSNDFDELPYFGRK